MPNQIEQGRAIRDRDLGMSLEQASQSDRGALDLKAYLSAHSGGLLLCC